MWVCITQRRKEGFFFIFFQQVEERHRCYKLVWEGKKYQDNDKRGKQVSEPVLWEGRKHVCVCVCFCMRIIGGFVLFIHLLLNKTESK